MTQVEIESVGRWPTNATPDIINAREELMKIDEVNIILFCAILGKRHPVDVRMSPSRLQKLDQHISETTVSYRRFFEENRIAKFVEDKEVADNIIFVSFGDNTVKINDRLERSLQWEGPHPA